MTDNLRPKWMDGPADNEIVDYDLVRECAWKTDKDLSETAYVDPQEFRTLARELLRVSEKIREVADKTLVTIDFTVRRDDMFPDRLVFCLEAQLFKALNKSGPSSYRRITVSDREAAYSKVPVIDLVRVDMARHVMATILDAIELRQVTQ